MPDVKFLFIIQIEYNVKFMGDNSLDKFTHKWDFSLTPLNNCCLDYVKFNLHQSFKNPVRKFMKPPYKIKETGYGGFDMEIIMSLFEKCHSETFEIRLYNYPPVNKEIDYFIICQKIRPKYFSKALSNGGIPIDDELVTDVRLLKDLKRRLLLEGPDSVPQHEFVGVYNLVRATIDRRVQLDTDSNRDSVGSVSSRRSNNDIINNNNKNNYLTVNQKTPTDSVSVASNNRRLSPLATTNTKFTTAESACSRRSVESSKSSSIDVINNSSNKSKLKSTMRKFFGPSDDDVPEEDESSATVVLNRKRPMTDFESDRKDGTKRARIEETPVKKVEKKSTTGNSNNNANVNTGYKEARTLIDEIFQPIKTSTISDFKIKKKQLPCNDNFVNNSAYIDNTKKKIDPNKSIEMKRDSVETSKPSKNKFVNNFCEKSIGDKGNKDDIEKRCPSPIHEESVLDEKTHKNDESKQFNLKNIKIPKKEKKNTESVEIKQLECTSSSENHNLKIKRSDVSFESKERSREKIEENIYKKSQRDSNNLGGNNNNKSYKNTDEIFSKKNLQENVQIDNVNHSMEMSKKRMDTKDIFYEETNSGDRNIKSLKQNSILSKTDFEANFEGNLEKSKFSNRNEYKDLEQIKFNKNPEETVQKRNAQKLVNVNSRELSKEMISSTSIKNEKMNSLEKNNRHLIKQNSTIYKTDFESDYEEKNISKGKEKKESQNIKSNEYKSNKNDGERQRVLIPKISSKENNCYDQSIKEKINKKDIMNEDTISDKKIRKPSSSVYKTNFESVFEENLEKPKLPKRIKDKDNEKSKLNDHRLNNVYNERTPTSLQKYDQIDRSYNSRLFDVEQTNKRIIKNEENKEKQCLKKSSIVNETDFKSNHEEHLEKTKSSSKRGDKDNDKETIPKIKLPDTEKIDQTINLNKFDKEQVNIKSIKNEENMKKQFLKRNSTVIKNDSGSDYEKPLDKDKLSNNNKVKEEKIKYESDVIKKRQENILEENIRQENINQENIRQENIHQENIRLENVHKESIYQESNNLDLIAAAAASISSPFFVPLITNSSEIETECLESDLPCVDNKSERIRLIEELIKIDNEIFYRRLHNLLCQSFCNLEDGLTFYEDSIGFNIALISNSLAQDLWQLVSDYSVKSDSF